MAAENSFDIACKLDMQEVSNAVNQTIKEIQQRYDLKGSNCEVVLEKTEITLTVPDDMKLRAVSDILQSRLHRRGVPLKALSYGKAEPAAGGALRQKIALQQGIPIEKAREIATRICKKSGQTLDIMKRTVRTGASLGLGEGLLFEAANFGLVFSTPHAVEGMKAFLEKREARFD